ncbi:hypothetical protein CIL05_02125 [Virgibacillus profundi]|uniref:RocC n=1 Tax=Virgibacillus profundi TaxID=2024555 RepID=A0A2A2IJN0_9BACI|nr:DUF1850 domain-containing protein [Virgibacillus profundi]PAV31474.1 hypothetical protein CIL05_02125 [Virgibacillus profundi]PXY55660.1 DUF1850 domain-containing protein [Virgibacillus profundi]
MKYLANKKTLFTITLLIFVILQLFVPFRTALVFYKENTNYIEAFLPINEEDTFQLIWKHSIHLTDVIEKYIVMDNQNIKQYEIIYEEFGIGMPSNALEGEKFEYKDGKYHVMDLDNIFPSINLRNGKTVPENRLVWGEQGEHIIYLKEYLKPGAWFTIKVENLSLWQSLKGVRIHE